MVNCFSNLSEETLPEWEKNKKTKMLMSLIGLLHIN